MSDASQGIGAFWRTHEQHFGRNDMTEHERQTRFEPNDAHAAVDAALQSIARQEDRIKAWTFVASPQALQDQQTHPTPGLLTGMPFGVKDIIDVADMPTRCGSLASSPENVLFDACCVSALRRAGAIPIGKTVTAEYAFRTPGPTRNPHHLDHTPGGSSSGSAAAVAAGMVPLALGTQTGGSMIRPAAYCGVVGFKPSFGAIFRDGMKMTSESIDTIGFYTRTVTTAARVARVLLPYKSNTPARAEKPLRIAFVGNYAGLDQDPETTELLEDIRDLMGAHDIQCESPPEFFQAAELAHAHAIVMTYELARNMAPVARRHAHQLGEDLLEIIKEGLKIPNDVYRTSLTIQRRMRHGWSEMFGAADLVLTPSAPGAAPAGLNNTGSSHYNRIWSLLGWPCLHIPIRTNRKGLPLGVQLIGDFDNDLRLLSAGAWIEEVIQGMPGARPGIP